VCAQAGAILYSVGLGRPSAAERKVGTKVKFAASLHCPVSITQRMPPRTRHEGGRRQSRQAWGPPTALLFEQVAQYKISKTKLSISMIAVTAATESTKASLASW